MNQYPSNSYEQENYQQAYSEIPSSYPPQPVQPGAPFQQPASGRGKATAALVLGIIGMVAWLLPIIGLPVSIVGLILAVNARRAFPGYGVATAGYVLCIIALVLSAGNSILGVMMRL
jgi:hypothetical protein